VVFCADRNYLPYFGVTAYSLLSHNSALGIAIVLVTDEVDEANQRRLDRLASEFDAPISVYRISARDRDVLAGVKPHGHLGIATYFRLLIPQAVPEEVTKVLYLDSDMIVDGDIAGLLDGAGADKVVGVCPDPVGRRLTRRPGYFNAGVMVIDLARWRELDVSGKAIRYASSGAHLPYCDQDALNEVVAADWIQWLGLEYNYMVYDRLKPELQQELRHAAGGVRAPRILHFAGQIKPWHGWYLAEHKEKYFDYARHSPWSDAPLAQDRPANPQQELWLGEVAERAADFRKAAHHYRRAAQGLLEQQAAQQRPPR
jgi:lipopolysaccharide biosynthesis glycosyltransferase